MHSVFVTTAEYSTGYHDLPRTARICSFLLADDQDLAERTRTNACPAADVCAPPIGVLVTSSITLVEPRESVTQAKAQPLAQRIDEFDPLAERVYRTLMRRPISDPAALSIVWRATLGCLFPARR